MSIQNIQSTRERENYKAFVEQLRIEEEQEQEKKMAPVHVLAAENSRLLVEIREKEKENLLLIPYEGSSDLLQFIDKVTKEHLKYTYDDWRDVSAVAALEAADYFDAKGIERPNESELKTIFQFCFAQ